MADCPRDCTDGLVIRGWKPTAEEPLPAVCPIHIGDLSQREIQAAQTVAAMAHYPDEYEAAINPPDDDVLMLTRWVRENQQAIQRAGGGGFRTAAQQQAMGAGGGGAGGSSHGGVGFGGSSGGGAGGAGGVGVGFDVGKDSNAMRFFSFGGRRSGKHTSIINLLS